VLANDPLELEPQFMDDELRFPKRRHYEPGGAGFSWLQLYGMTKIRVVTAYDAPKYLIEPYLRSRE